jgi:hypothetical protein
MKNKLALLFLLPVLALAQTTPAKRPAPTPGAKWHTSNPNAWKQEARPLVTAVGPVNPVIDLSKDTLPIMLRFSVHVTGKVYCQYQIESSDDQVTWSPTVFSETLCPVSDSAKIDFPFINHKYIRVNVTKFNTPQGSIGNSVAFTFRHGDHMESRWKKKPN